MGLSEHRVQNPMDGNNVPYEVAIYGYVSILNTSI